jgi:hypothetical protein
MYVRNTLAKSKDRPKSIEKETINEKKDGMFYLPLKNIEFKKLSL